MIIFGDCTILHIPSFSRLLTFYMNSSSRLWTFLLPFWPSSFLLLHSSFHLTDVHCSVFQKFFLLPASSLLPLAFVLPSTPLYNFLTLSLLLLAIVLPSSGLRPSFFTFIYTSTSRHPSLYWPSSIFLLAFIYFHWPSCFLYNSLLIFFSSSSSWH